MLSSTASADLDAGVNAGSRDDASSAAGPSPGSSGISSNAQVCAAIVHNGKLLSEDSKCGSISGTAACSPASGGRVAGAQPFKLAPPSYAALGAAVSVGVGALLGPAITRAAAEVAVANLLEKAALPAASMRDLAAARLLCLNFLGWNANRCRLYDFQRFLPGLPLPDVASTVRRWLLTVQPLLKQDEFQELNTLASTFLQEVRTDGRNSSQAGETPPRSAATGLQAVLLAQREQVLQAEENRVRWGEHVRPSTEILQRIENPELAGKGTPAGLLKGWSAPVASYYPGPDGCARLVPTLVARAAASASTAIGMGWAAALAGQTIPRSPAMQCTGNWLRDTWLKFAYLRGRKPLLVHSSFYSTEMCWQRARTRDPTARAAGMAGAALEMMDRIDTQTLPAMLLGGTHARQGPAPGKKAASSSSSMHRLPSGSQASPPPPPGGFIPVCMDGYRYMFGCFRLPGTEEDIIQVTRPAVVREQRAKGQRTTDTSRASTEPVVATAGPLCLVPPPAGCVGGPPAQTKDPLPRRMGDLDMLVLRGTATWLVPLQRGGERASPEQLHLALQVVCTLSPYTTGIDQGMGSQQGSFRYTEESGDRVGFDCSAGDPRGWTHRDSPPVAMLTTLPRDRWARARRALQQESFRNADNLRRIEKTAFVVSLPDAAPLPEGDPNAHVRWMLHGNGTSLWADCVFNFVVFRNGRGGTSIEHTPADAPIPSHVVEHVVVHEGRFAPSGTYDPDWATTEDSGFFLLAKDRLGSAKAHRMFTRRWKSSGSASGNSSPSEVQGGSTPPPESKAESSSAASVDVAESADDSREQGDESKGMLRNDVSGSFKALSAAQLRETMVLLGMFVPERLSWDGFDGAATKAGDAASAAVMLQAGRQSQGPTGIEIMQEDASDDVLSADQDSARGSLPLALSRAAASFQDLASSVGMRVLQWLHWGKETVKTRARCSPDALVQMALQLAARRYFGRPVLTYESASTRRFHLGRTDTIRSCSTEAVNFVNAALLRLQLWKQNERSTGPSDDNLAEPSISRRGASHPTINTVRKLFQDACKRHKQLSTEAGLGQGVDRHMMSLQIAAMTGAGAAAGVGADHPGLGLLYSRAAQLPYELSTSQTPLVAENFGLELPACASLGGGFGPTAVPGIGVSYFILPSTLYFHVSATAPDADDGDALSKLAPMYRAVARSGSVDAPQRLAVAFAGLVRESLQWMQEELFVKAAGQAAL